MPERERRLTQGLPIIREHRACERIRRGLVDDRQRLAPFRVVIDIRGDDRTENLLAQEPVRWLVSLDERGRDVVAVLTLGLATGDDSRVATCVVEVLADLVEGLLVDYRAHKVS